MKENTPKKKNRLLNFFDIIIIGLVIGAVAIFIIWRSSGSSDSPQFINSTEKSITYTVELTGLKNDVWELINVGDSLVDTAKKYDVGTITDIKLSPSVRSVFDETTGKFIMSEVPNEVTALLTIEATAVESDTEFTVSGGFVVRGGTSVSLRGPGYYGSGYILYIERGDDAA